MPFHIRCMGCKKMIAKGVRFNAVKKKKGRYLGTMIFEFIMPCPSCKNTMVIKTDPKNCEYLLVSGCVKYADDYEEETEEAADKNKIQTPEEGEAFNRNAFLKLESQKVDIIRAEERKPLLRKIIEEREIFRDDFAVNQTLRRKLKIEKNHIRKQENESKMKGLDIKLLPGNEEDRLLSQIAKFRPKDNKFNIRDTFRLEPIFKNNKLYSNREKNEEIINLLKKKQKLDRSLQFSLEKERSNLMRDKCLNLGSFSNSLKIGNNINIIIKKKI